MNPYPGLLCPFSGLTVIRPPISPPTVCSAPVSSAHPMSPSYPLRKFGVRGSNLAEPLPMSAQGPKLLVLPS